MWNTYRVTFRVTKRALPPKAFHLVGYIGYNWVRCEATEHARASSQSPAVGADHVGLGPSLIDEDEAGRISQLALLRARSGPSRSEGNSIFFKLTPSRSKNRQIEPIPIATSRSVVGLRSGSDQAELRHSGCLVEAVEPAAASLFSKSDCPVEPMTLNQRVPGSSPGAPTTQSPQNRTFPSDTKWGVSAGIFGISLYEFWSLQAFERLSGDFGGPVSASKNSVPGG